MFAQIVERVPIPRSDCIWINSKDLRNLPKRQFAPDMHDYDLPLICRKLFKTQLQLALGGVIVFRRIKPSAIRIQVNHSLISLEIV